MKHLHLPSGPWYTMGKAEAWTNVHATCTVQSGCEMARPATREAADERRKMVLAMFMQGHTYRHIARTLKCCPGTVSNDLKRIKKKLDEGKLQEVMAERRTQTYDMVLDTLRQIRDTHLGKHNNVQSAKVAILATEKLTKLLGFNAPEQFVVNSTNKQDGPVELVVKGVRAKQKPSAETAQAEG